MSAELKIVIYDSDSDSNLKLDIEKYSPNPSIKLGGGFIEIVAHINSKIVGYMAIKDDGIDNIDVISIHLDHQRQGIATKLFEYYLLNYYVAGNPLYIYPMWSESRTLVKYWKNKYPNVCIFTRKSNAIKFKNGRIVDYANEIVR